MDNVSKHTTQTAAIFTKQTEEHIERLRNLTTILLKERIYQSNDIGQDHAYQAIDNKYFPAKLLPVVFEEFINTLRGIEFYAYENYSPFEKVIAIIDFCAVFENMLNQVSNTSYWLWPSKSIAEVKDILASNENMAPALAKLGYDISDLLNLVEHREYLNILFKDICLFSCKEVGVLAGFMYLNPFIALDYLANYTDNEKTSYTNFVNKEDIGRIKDALVNEFLKKYNVDYYKLMNEVKINNASDLERYQKLFNHHSND